MSQHVTKLLLTHGKEDVLVEKLWGGGLAELSQSYLTPLSLSLRNSSPSSAPTDVV